MCGIMGCFGEQLEERHLELLRHRGPDSSGFVRLDELILGHTRLSIQDLSSAGCQPFFSEDKSIVIVYNGEIYAYENIKSELIADGYHFKSTSDTEIILNLYLRDGENLLSKLNGIFSFAIWDKRKKQLFLARDGMGVKPLYYTENSKGFMFASELKVLLQSAFTKRDLNYKAIMNHLTYLWSPSPETMIEGIKKLEPGNALLVNKQGIFKKWQYVQTHYTDIKPDINEEDAINEVRRLVSQAVKRQLVSDVPVGAFLSGGLDSSAVVAFAKEHYSKQNIQTFSIDLQNMGKSSEGATDDLPYAKNVAKHLGVDLNIIKVGPEIINSLEDMIYYLDEPQADPAALNVMYISKLARENGIKVLLSGAGGDDIFTGYRRHYAISKEYLWSWLPQFIRKSISNASQCLNVKNHFLRRLAKTFAYASLPERERLISYFYWINPEYLMDVFSKLFREEISGYVVSSILSKSLDELPENIEPIDKMLFLETKYFLTDHNLNYTDKMGMSEGVEIRVPLLDPDLVKYAASLPKHFKQNGSESKWIFKKAMEGILPDNIIYRPKTGFAAPLRYWLTNELSEVVDDTLSYASLTKRNIFDPKGVERLRELNRKKKIDASYTIFSMVCIELWCRLFLDNTKPTYH